MGIYMGVPVPMSFGDTLVAWGVPMLMCAVLVLATGGAWTAPGYEALQAMGLTDFAAAGEPGSLAGFALAAPLALVALLPAQTAVTLLAGPYAALAATMAVLLMSAYYMHPALPGEYLMAARSAALLGGGADPGRRGPGRTRRGA